MIHRSAIAALSMLALAADAQPPAEAGLEAQVIALINEARTDPAAYASKLREYRGHFEGNVVTLPGSDVGLRTREGVAAVDEAIAFLARQEPLTALRSAPELEASARELAVAHRRSPAGPAMPPPTEPDAKVRIKRHKGSGLTAEVLAYGASDAAECRPPADHRRRRAEPPEPQDPVRGEISPVPGSPAAPIPSPARCASIDLADLRRPGARLPSRSGPRRRRSTSIRRA